MLGERRSRRSVGGLLARGAGAMLVLAAGGGVWRAAEQDVLDPISGDAWRPWEDWHERRHSGAMALVSAAVLASSPHNTQPWLFRVTEAAIDLYADPTRHLGALDPFRREMHIGLGCAIENIEAAGRGLGLATSVALLPDPAVPLHVARIALTPGQARPDDRFEAIRTRRTDRGPYKRDTRVPALAQSVLLAQAQPFDVTLSLIQPDTEAGRLLMEGTLRATEAIGRDPALLAAGHQWFRHERDAIATSRDGISVLTAGLPPARRAMAMLLPAPSAQAAHAHWEEAARTVHLPTAAGFGVIGVRSRADRRESLQAGRLWQRLHLIGTAIGLAMQPLNQLPELADHEANGADGRLFSSLVDRFAPPPARQITFVFRFGYPERDPAASPRRSVDSVLRSV